ncbi:MAG: hypothetical protein AAFQ87_27860, partial [Bacteroidota bacterium]
LFINALPFSLDEKGEKSSPPRSSPTSRPISQAADGPTHLCYYQMGRWLGASTRGRASGEGFARSGFLRPFL